MDVFPHTSNQWFSFVIFICISGVIVPLPCQRGFYCPNGSAHPHPCPSGTYGNTSGLTGEWQCLLCDPGMYCKGAGKTQSPFTILSALSILVILVGPIDTILMKEWRWRIKNCRRVAFLCSRNTHIKTVDSAWAFNRAWREHFCLFDFCEHR